MSVDTVQVPLSERSYTIHMGCGLLARAGDMLQPLLPSSRALVVSDTHVAPLYHATLARSLAGSGIANTLLTIPPGEESKSFPILMQLLEQALDTQPDRHTCVIALGGGVVGDLAGFAASMLLRGVPFVQIPTTLLSQVDSSVGGKTGINMQHGKNLVGSFYQPRAVLIDIDTLATLPERELRSGYAEVVKYGLLGDEHFFAWLEKHGEGLLAGDTQLLQEAVRRSCEAKARIVAEDERESGIRALLNLGHTFAHALEAETGYSDILKHGEAVALGMVLAFRLSHALGYCPAENAERAARHIQRMGLPVSLQPFNLNPEALLAHMRQDKKAYNGKLTFVLVKGIGRAFIARDVPEPAVRAVLE